LRAFDHAAEAQPHVGELRDQYRGQAAHEPDFGIREDGEVAGGRIRGAQSAIPVARRVMPLVNPIYEFSLIANVTSVQSYQANILPIVLMQKPCVRTTQGFVLNEIFIVLNPFV